MLCTDHIQQPDSLKDDSQMSARNGKYTDFQTSRGASVIVGYLNYLETLVKYIHSIYFLKLIYNEPFIFFITKSNTVQQESTKTGPLCMNQYKYLFGITRIPKEKCDVLNGSFPPTSKHIIVIAQDQIYKCCVYKDGKMLGSGEIKA